MKLNFLLTLIVVAGCNNSPVDDANTNESSSKESNHHSLSERAAANADATRDYWYAMRELVQREMATLPRKKPETLEEFASSLELHRESLHRVAKFGGSFSVNGVDSEVVRYMGKNLKLSTQLINDIEQVELILSLSNQQSVDANKWHAWAEYLAEGITFKTDAIDSAIDEAKKLERQFIEATTTLNKRKAESHGLIDDELQVRNSMNSKYGINLESFFSLSNKEISANNVEWRGSCTQPNMKPYPMIMQIAVGHDNEISGTINWPTLNNSTTRFSGTIDGTKVRFVETELLSGSEIGIPCVYDGDLLGDTIAGTCIYQDIQGAFSVTAVKR